MAELNTDTTTANLGGGVYKKRVARQGSGKRGGARVILVYQNGDHAFFIFGFCKSEKANLTRPELLATKKLAHELLSYSSMMINQAINSGEMMEVQND